MRLTTKSLLILAPTLLAGCFHARDDASTHRIVGSGNVVTIRRSPDSFHSIRLTGIGHLIVEQDTRASVSLTADDNLATHLVSNVVDGVLHLHPRHGVKIDTRLGIVWRVRVRRLESMHTDGLVSAEAIGIVGDTLHIDMEGLSTVEASGAVRRARIEADGVVTYRGSALAAEECDLDCDGVLNLAVRATKLVRGRACGTGTVRVHGGGSIDVERCPLVVFRRH